MIEITVNWASAEVLFAELVKKTSATRPAMVAISGVLMDAVEENFEQQGRPKWPKLSEARIKERKRKGTWPGKILTEYGQLATSFSPRATNDSAIVGTNVRYAAAQFLGLPENNVPARNALTFLPEDMAEAELVLLRHLLR
ncbi:MAG: phage virion morphogenesis protein [Fibrobacteria bacterium]